MGVSRGNEEVYREWRSGGSMVADADSGFLSAFGGSE
jgi:hypothetical protein